MGKILYNTQMIILKWLESKYFALWSGIKLCFCGKFIGSYNGKTYQSELILKQLKFEFKLKKCKFSVSQIHMGQISHN